jgi:hypothetical protein
MEIRVLVSVYTRFWYIFMGLFILFSCTKEVDITYPKTEQQLVIEGYIENGKYPRVFLTKTSPFFEKVDSSNILNLIGSVGKVTISSLTESEVLTLRFDEKLFPPYYFEGTSIKGEIGKTYQIKVDIHGSSYTASTTIEKPVSVQKISVVQTTKNSEQKFLNIHFSDPENEKNFYRVYTKRLGKDKDFTPCYLSTFNDFGFDGKEYDFEVIRSYSPIVNTDNGRYFVTGDSVLVKFCAISAEQHDYWKKIEAQITVSGNPFGLASSEPTSLIQGGALGVWSGLGSNTYLVVIKE